VPLEKGHGVGLQSVWQILKANKGALQISSELYVGTDVMFCLPTRMTEIDVSMLTLQSNNLEIITLPMPQPTHRRENEQNDLEIGQSST
jgi:hypothetical protein